MARTDLAIVKRNAIFVKEKKDGRYVYGRRPFDIVEYNWGDTSANRTYIQPHFNSTFDPLGALARLRRHPHLRRAARLRPLR